MDGIISLVAIIVIVLFSELSISIENPQITFRVIEEEAPGKFIGHLRSVPGLSTPKKNLRYSFLSLNDLRVASLFRINSVTSGLKTAKKIDREIFCEFLVECVIKFDVQVRSVESSYFEIFVVRIIVEDINDNSPEFQSDEITIFIRENINIGSGYRVSGAVDRDGTPNNSVQFYELVSNTDDFNFNEIKKLDGSTDLEIVIMKNPDRELKGYYRFFIVASDNGDPQLSSKLIINVNITDENDNAPIFSELDYNVTVREDTPPYTVIGRVLATDEDSGINSVLTYSFSSKRSELFRSLFAINPQNGRLSVRNELLLYSGRQLSVVVEATDSGSPSLTSQAKVTVSIMDIGNNPPKIVISPIVSNDGPVVLLSEASRVGTPVAHIEVIDMDRGHNGEVECKLVHDYFSLQSLKGRGYIIQVQSTLDREDVDDHNLTIMCEDFGNPRLLTTVRVYVRLLDENDNKPQFTSSVYQINMVENNDVDKFIVSVSATDADTGPNSLIQYFLRLPFESLFQIDKTSGDITTNSSLDRELMSVFKLRVLAIDMGNSPLTGTCDVHITINDLNDNSPMFDHDPLIFSVFENVELNSTVEILQANDADSGENGEITYYTANNAMNSSFHVLPSGLIKTSAHLDYEQQTIYVLQAVAADHGVPRLSTSVTLTIYILDTNDHAPEILFKNDSKSVVTVPSDTKVGVPIYKVNASDKDEGENAKLFYSRIDGNSDSIFLIRSKTGEVVLTRRITREDKEIHNLTISVRDNGKVPLSTFSYFTFQIEHVNSTSVLENGTTSFNHPIIIPVSVTCLVLLLVCALIVLLICFRKSRSFYPNSKKVHKEEYENIKNQRYVWQRINEQELSVPVPVQEIDLAHMLNGRDDVKSCFDYDRCIDLHESKQLVTFKCPRHELDIDFSDEGSAVEDSGQGASEEDTMVKIPILDSPGQKQEKNILQNDFGLRHTII